jgi:acyl-coenzyme A synthetase/AMP-(fatty) acid ligase
MPLIPLLGHQSPDAVVAWRGGTAITAGQFLADARALAQTMPVGRHVLNVCSDRYRFAVGFAASLIAAKTSLLPPTQVPEVIRHLQAFAPDAFCLTDEADCDIALPRLQYPRQPAAPADFALPEIAGDFIAAHVFTSGSTGVPVPHAKSWAYLAADVAVEAQRMGLDDGRRWVIVATVPPQHMYGFESSVLVAWRSGQSFCAERPF